MDEGWFVGDSTVGGWSGVWPRNAHEMGWIRGCEDTMTTSHQKGPSWGPATLLGVPFDENSSYQRGAAAAPPVIREAFNCKASNSWTETGVDLGAAGVFEDVGDLSL